MDLVKAHDKVDMEALWNVVGRSKGIPQGGKCVSDGGRRAK